MWQKGAGARKACRAQNDKQTNKNGFIIARLLSFRGGDVRGLSGGSDDA